MQILNHNKIKFNKKVENLKEILKLKKKSFLFFYCFKTVNKLIVTKSEYLSLKKYF